MVSVASSEKWGSTKIYSLEFRDESYGANQLLRIALGGRGVGHGVTLCDRGGGSAERYVTPKIIYMYNINYNFYCYMYVYSNIFIHVLL